MIVLNREVGESLRRDKFVNVQGGDFNLYGHFADFVRLTKSWENMEPDSYYGQAESGMRFRRYSDFEYNPVTRELTQLEHRAYVQSKANNSYVGGMVRHFQDFSDEVINSPVMRSLIDIDFEVYKNVLPPELHDEIWQCQIHQIRIEIKPGKQLEITPKAFIATVIRSAACTSGDATMWTVPKAVSTAPTKSNWRRRRIRKSSTPRSSSTATCATT